MMAPMHPLRACLIATLTAVATLAFIDGAVYGSGLHDRFLHRYFPWVDRQPERMLALTAPRQPQVLALGDSKARRGFRPAVFDAAAGLERRGLTSGQIGVITEPLGFMAVMLRAYLEQAPPPAVALLLLSPSDFYWWPPERVPAQMYDLYRGPEDWPETFTARAQANMWLCTVWQLWRYRDETAQVLAVALTQSPRETAESLEPPPGADRWWRRDVQRGWWPTERSYEVHAQDPLYGMFRKYPVSSQAAQFRRLLDRCHEHRIRPIIVWMPQYGHTSAEPDGEVVTAYLNGLGADAVVDMSASCRDRRYWQDGTHLNTLGARRFSEDLGHRLAPRLGSLAVTRHREAGR